MDAKELRAALAEMGWNQSSLANRLSVHNNTVSEWCQGHRPVPGYVSEYLRVATLAKRILDGRDDSH